MANDLLIEIGSEEIPARAMVPVLRELKEKFTLLLEEQKLGFDGIETFGSARRLVVHVTNLDDKRATEKITTLGPPEKIAFKNGEPSKALEGFARKFGLKVEVLQVFDSENGRYMGFESEVKGRSAPEILSNGVPPIINSLTFPKTMYWRETGQRFARPIRWVVALFKGNVVPMEICGVTSGDRSAGHRILGSQSIPVSDFDDYLTKLKENVVIVSQEFRREKVQRELDLACRSLGGTIIVDDALLEEVIYINEFPTVLVGTFEKQFLELPREVLITVMREHQKYFAVENKDGLLLPCFLGVMNTKSDPHGMIQKGHERVLKARLSDALFFWNLDGKRSLADRVDALASVTFHKMLGTYKDKVDRMANLSGQINELTGARIQSEVLAKIIGWSKSDLVTDLVGEFAGLQGIVGGLYARREGASEDIWRAIYDQYRPAGLDDRSPETISGVILALTDRLDTVLGCFAVGLIPTGSADPLALRRHTQGIIKILMDHRLPFSMHIAIAHDGRLDAKASEAFNGFYVDRLRFVLQRRGFAYDEINAVIATDSDNPANVLMRLEALHEVRESPDLLAIAAAFKRIKNILKQAETELDGTIDRKGMEPEETALADQVDRLQPQIERYALAGEYGKALDEIATLRPFVDEFFDEILVMHEDPKIKRRRLLILKNLFEMFLQVADVSEVVVAS